MSIGRMRKTMTLLGHIKNGRIELDQPLALPEGAKVQIAVLDGMQDIAGKAWARSC